MLHKKYLAEFKAAAIRQVENGKDIKEVAGTLGVNKNTLYGWWLKAGNRQ